MFLFFVLSFLNAYNIQEIEDVEEDECFTQEKDVFSNYEDDERKQIIKLTVILFCLIVVIGFLLFFTVFSEGENQAQNNLSDGNKKDNDSGSDYINPSDNNESESKVAVANNNFLDPNKPSAVAVGQEEEGEW